MRITWEEVAPLPVGLSAHAAVLLQGSVYVGGGLEGKSITDKKPSYKLHIYNICANQWSTSPIITPHCSFAMTILDDKLIIAGGDKDDVPTNKVHILDRGVWKYYSAMPTARTDLSAVGYQSMLITVGGQIKINTKWTKLATTELLDTTNGCWYACDDLPVPHSQLKCVVVTGILYLLGGVSQGTKPSLQVFTASLGNLSSHQLKWQSLPDTPWCYSAPVALYNKFLLTVGGREPSDKASQTTEVCAFNPSTGVWRQIMNIPEPRHLPGTVCTTSNQLIVLGGLTRQGQYSTNSWIGICE